LQIAADFLAETNGSRVAKPLTADRQKPNVRKSMQEPFYDVLQTGDLISAMIFHIHVWTIRIVT
jgi:hypothetical protein